MEVCWCWWFSGEREDREIKRERKKGIAWVLCVTVIGREMEMLWALIERREKIK